MAINVSALNGYFSDETRFNIASKAVLEANDVKYLNVFDNVNGSMLLSTVDTAIYITNDECSTRTDSGSTVFAGNTLATTPLVIYNEVCNKKLQRYFLGKKGASEQGIDGELMTALIDEKLEKSLHEISKVRWQGVENSATYKHAVVTGNLTAGSGYFQKAYEMSATTVNVAKSAITSTTGYQIVDAYADNIPEAIEGRQDLYLFLSPSDFRNYMKSLRSAQFLQASANYDANAEGITEIYHPGELALKVVKNDGMAGMASGSAIISYTENMGLGCLKDPAAMVFDAWYEKSTDKVCFELYALQGVNFVYAEHVVVAR